MSTSWPAYEDDWRKRWVQSSTGFVLHRVSEMPDYWFADGGFAGGRGRTVCGVRSRLIMPGLFSRLGSPRCRRCCRIVGVPYGDRVPFNDKTLSEEQRNA